MSLVNEYLRKTQDEAGDTSDRFVVPPSLTHGGRRSKEGNPIKIGLVAAAIIGVVILVVAGYPMLRDLISPSGTEEAAQTASVQPGGDKTAPDPAPAATAKPAQAGRPEAAPQKSAPAQQAPETQVSQGSGASEQAQPPVKANQTVAAPPAPEPAPQAKPAQPAPAPPTAVSKEPVYAVPVTPDSSGGSMVFSPEGNIEDYSAAYSPSAISVSSRKVGEALESGSQTSSGSTALKKEIQGGGEKYLQLGLAAQKNGDYLSAEEYYHAGIKLAPTDLSLLSNLAAVYIQMGKYDQSFELLQQALKLDSNNLKVLVNLGIVELARNNNDRAKNWFIRALELNPIDETVLTNLAYLAQVENNPVEMEKYYRKILGVSPENSEVMLAYASVLEQTDRVDEAVSVYKQALDLSSVRDNPELVVKIRKRIQLLAQY